MPCLSTEEVDKTSYSNRDRVQQAPHHIIHPHYYRYYHDLSTCLFTQHKNLSSRHRLF